MYDVSFVSCFCSLRQWDKHELPRFDVLSNNPFAVRRERDPRGLGPRGSRASRPSSDVDRIVVPATLAFFVE